MAYESKLKTREMGAGAVSKIHALFLHVLCQAAVSDFKLMEKPEFEDALFRIIIAFSRGMHNEKLRTSSAGYAKAELKV